MEVDHQVVIARLVTEIQIPERRSCGVLEIGAEWLRVFTPHSTSFLHVLLARGRHWRESVCVCERETGEFYKLFKPVMVGRGFQLLTTWSTKLLALDQGVQGWQADIEYIVELVWVFRPLARKSPVSTGIHARDNLKSQKIACNRMNGI